MRFSKPKDYHIKPKLMESGYTPTATTTAVLVIIYPDDTKTKLIDY